MRIIKCSTFNFFRMLDGLHPTFYPMIWFETTTRINGKTATGRLIVLVSRLNQIIYGIGGLILVISLIFVGFGLFKLNRKRKTEYKIRG